MPFWKQLLIAIPLCAATVLLLAFNVPAARPALERAGIAGALERLGIAPSAEGATPPPESAPRSATEVFALPPGEGMLDDTVSAIGNGRALRSVVVTPEVSGQIVEMAVASGMPVEAGETIARLDSEAEEIAAARAAFVLDDARDRYERMARLQRSGTASDTQIREVELALRQAELALRQAEFDLSRREIRAPIDGWVGIVAAETGHRVAPGTQIVTIDDRSVILVDFRLPERVVGRITPGDTVAARPLAWRTGAALEGQVSAIDNRVDQASRTLLVQARLENDDDRLRAGMAFAISFALPGEPLPAVDPLAVQWSTTGSFVWVVRDGRAQELPVRIVQRGANAVLVEADFAPGDLVVVSGVQVLRPGAEVRLRGPAAAAGTGDQARDAPMEAAMPG